MKKKFYLGRRPAYCFGLALAFALLLYGPQKTRAQQWTTTGNNISNTNTGNVGIGTASPQQTLDINGIVTFGGSNGYIRHDDAGYLHFQGGATGISFSNNANNTKLLTILNSGNVGIGTATPGKRLEVLAPDGEAVRLYRNAANAGWGVNIKFAFNNSGGAEVDYAGVHGLVASPTAGAEGGNLVFTTATSGALTEKMRIDSAGNVGIGTASPTSKLQVVPTSEGDGVRVVGSTAGPIDPSYGLFDGATGRGFFGLAEVSGAYSTSAAPGDVVLRADTGRLHLQTGVGSAAMTIAGGNVGIGKTNPSVALDVTGGISATGTITGGSIQATYQDVAEWVPSTQKLSAGTVVVLDTNRTNQVLASSKPYDTKVAGVVSAQPGISLGQGGDGKLLVATTGRVRVKVDATRAPVKVGDLLVTSGVEGLAMKSIPVDLGGTQIHRPGTIIGKALEPLASGTGEILVLLSLQ